MVNERNRNRTFLLGVVLLGLTFLTSLAYSQLSYDSYTQASSRATQLHNRMDDLLVVRGKINNVVEAISDEDLHFANPSLAIDQRVWNLQNAWSDFHGDQRPVSAGARFLTPSPTALDTAIDQFALAALRNAGAVRRGNATAQPALQLTAALDPQLAAMEGQISKAIETAEAQRDNAMIGMSYGRSLAYGAFFALSALALTGMLVSGVRGFKEWMGRERVAAINANKLASPQR